MTNFIPMLSSSPPPIDDIDTPDNDDEFGIFTSADCEFDCSFESPLSSPKNDSSCVKQNVQKSKNIDYKESNNHKSTPRKDSLKDKVNDKTELSFIIANNCSQNGIVKTSTIYNESNFEESEGFIVNESSFKEIVNSDDTVSESSTLAKTSSQIQSCNTKFGSSDSNGIDGSKIVKNYPVSDSDIGDITIHCESNESENVYNFQIDVLKDPSEGIEASNSCDILKTSEISEEINEKANSVCSNQNSDELNCPEDGAHNGEVPDLTFIPYTEGDDEDDDDFADFCGNNQFCQETVTGENEEEDSKLSLHSESDDEFGNFESGKPVQEEFQSFEDSKISDFADFSNTEFKDSEHSDVNESVPDGGESLEFADFEAAAAEMPTVATTKDTVKNVNKISTVINAVFPLSEDCNVSASADDTCIISDNSCGVLDQNCKSCRLWDKLHETDRVPSLSSQWSVSHSFQQLLRSVNVDYHSILRTSTVPFFASGLGLLEPTKGAAAAPECTKSDNNFRTFKDPIPPVHFDWGSSGLVNPLDNGQAISSLMDLTFLNKSGNSTPQSDVQKNFSFEAELLTDTLPSLSQTCHKAPILEQLLSLGAKSSIAESHSVSRPPGLSHEAASVLDQLPDISYVRAQMLMFPISSDT